MKKKASRRPGERKTALAAARAIGGDADARTLRWVIRKITEWRTAVGIARLPDATALWRAVRALHRAGIPAGLVTYVILGCEWLFRVERQRGGRRVVSLAEQGPPSIFAFGRTAWDPFAEPLATDRDRLESRRGPVPWPAPWISGVLAGRMLELSKGNGQRTLPLQLVSALLGEFRKTELVEFKRLRRGLSGTELDRLLEEFSHYYQRMPQDAPSRTDWARDWPKILRERLECFGPGNTFPVREEIIREVLRSYSRRGNVGYGQ